MAARRCKGISIAGPEPQHGLRRNLISPAEARVNDVIRRSTRLSRWGWKTSARAEKTNVSAGFQTRMSANPSSAQKTKKPRARVGVASAAGDTKTGVDIFSGTACHTPTSLLQPWRKAGRRARAGWTGGPDRPRLKGTGGRSG
jgi:hypothetical protein